MIGESVPRVLPPKPRITNPRGEPSRQDKHLRDPTTSTNYTYHDHHNARLEKMPQSFAFTTKPAQGVRATHSRPQLQRIECAVAPAVLPGLPRPIMAIK
jgi:hypothetical protein